MAILTDTELRELALGPKSIRSGDKSREAHSLGDLLKLNAVIGETVVQQSSQLPLRRMVFVTPGGA